MNHVPWAGPVELGRQYPNGLYYIRVEQNGEFSAKQFMLLR